jgi:hypothetical protein
MNNITNIKWQPLSFRLNGAMEVAANERQTVFPKQVGYFFSRYDNAG